ncbi:MAG: histidine kinase [Proteobacteria bacterium]|nr:histidine kinase [Pseudomonadota bacterium]
MDASPGQAEARHRLTARSADTTAAERHPLFDRYLAANLAVWGITYVGTSVRSLGMGTPLAKLLGLGARRAVVTLICVGLCMLIQRVLLATGAWSWTRRFLLSAGLSLAGVVGWTLINHLIFYILWPVGPMDEGWNEVALSWAYNGSVMIWSFIAWCAIVLALSYDSEARQQSLRLVEAQALAAESQNQMLRNQINPHFLFNTLNALSSLILQKDVERAERMVLSLSNFLRASLEKAPSDKIALADELTVQRQYLAIEQERFGDRLVFRETAPMSLGDALVPGLILQPLIENAVKYGVARTTRPVTIEIKAQALDGALMLTVRDDAVPDIAQTPAAALGVGLENVRRRLQVLYGEAGVLACGPREGGGFAATIELPLERLERGA